MPRNRLFMAFDYGSRRIGVAVGQELTAAAHAVAVLTDRKGQPDWDAIARLLEEWHPDALVVGVPLHLDGTEHEITAAARRFARRLAGRFGLPVHEADERLSSVEAEDVRRTRGGARDRLQTDAWAAVVILEAWMQQAGETDDGSE